MNSEKKTQECKEENTFGGQSRPVVLSILCGGFWQAFDEHVDVVVRSGRGRSSGKQFDEKVDANEVSLDGGSSDLRAERGLVSGVDDIFILN